MKKILALALCLLSILACVKRPAPERVAADPPVLPQFERLNELYGQFQGFRNDQLFLRHGFTANFPQSDWLPQVQALGQDPDLAERARLLASLAVAARIHGDSSRVTRSFEDRFVASLRSPGPALPEEGPTTPEDNGTIDHAEVDDQPLQAPVAPAGEAAQEPADRPSSDDAGIVDTATRQIPVPNDALPPSLVDPESEAPPAPSVQAPAEAAAVTSPDTMTQPMTAEPILTVPAAVEETRPASKQESSAGPSLAADSAPTGGPQDGITATTPAESAAPSLPVPAGVDEAGPALEHESVPAPSREAEGELAAWPAADADAMTLAESPPFPAANLPTGASVGADMPVPSPVPPVPAVERPAGADLPAEAGPATGMVAPLKPETGEQEVTVAEMTPSVHTPPIRARQPQTTQTARTDRITLLFTGDTKGLVSPQPGIAGTLGGVARRLPTVEHVRTATPSMMLLDAGDAFASGFVNAQRVNRALVRAMNRMRYDALGLGPNDLAMGEVALRELVSISSFPFVCSNLEFQTTTTPWIKPYVIAQREGRKIAIISLLVPHPTLKITGARFVPPAQALAKLMPQLTAQADAVILMTQAGREEMLPLLGSEPGVTVVLGDAASGFQESPRYIPAVANSLGLTLVELDKTNGAFRPGRSIPLLTSGSQNDNILKILNEIE